MIRIKDKENTNTKDFWDAYYTSVDVEDDRLIIYEQLDGILSGIEFNTIMEIGCGTGIGGKYLKDKYQCHYTGTDFSDIAVKKAAQYLDETYLLDARTQLPATRYDVIIIAETLEHLEKPFAVIDRCLDYCKHLVLSLPLNEPQDCDPEHLWYGIDPMDFDGYNVHSVQLNEYYFQIILT